MLFNTLNQAVELGWDFYLPVIIFVVLAALAVPVWASIGVAAITMLLMSGDLPLALVGESLFDGIDAFALTADLGQQPFLFAACLRRFQARTPPAPPPWGG